MVLLGESGSPSIGALLAVSGLIVAGAPVLWWNWHPQSAPRAVRNNPVRSKAMGVFLGSGSTAGALVLWPGMLFGWADYLYGRTQSPLFLYAMWVTGVLTILAVGPALSTILLGRPRFLIPPQFRITETKGPPERRL